jgi:prevent-host-death family protein
MYIQRKETAMIEVKVTEFRNHLPEYLGRVKKGEDVLLTSRGKVIARITPAADERDPAREALVALRGKCRVGDVVTPLDERWEANDGAP